MAFLKITQLPTNDSDISYGDLLTVVDVETGTNRKMTIGAFKKWVDEELGEHYTSDHFTQDLLDAGIAARLDSEHSWNVSDHNDIRTDINNLTVYVDAKLDSVDGELSQISIDISNLESDLSDRLDSLQSNQGSILDSEHAWNVSEHAALRSDLDSLDGDINTRLDSLETSVIAELTANLDSAVTDLNASLDSEHSWNVSSHNALRSDLDSLDGDVNSRLDSLETSVIAELTANLDSAVTDLNASIDSEHAWNVSEHNELRSDLDSLDGDVNTRLDSLETSVIAELTSNLDSAVTDLNSSLDSEHAWNISEHESLNSSVSDRLDSEHSWNVSSHNALRSDLSSEIDSAIDSEHSWNVSEHASLNSKIDSAIDSEHAWNVSEHSSLNSKIDSEHGWNVSEHADLRSDLDSLNSQINYALDSEHSWNNTQRGYLESRFDSAIDSEHSWNISEHASLNSSVSARLDSEHSWNIDEHNALDNLKANVDDVDSDIARVTDLIPTTTDSVPEGTTNLYYSDLRVESKVNSQVDSNFLNDRMPIGNLSDVQVPSPTVDNFLQWNGSVWQDHELVIEANISFKGVVDATVDTSPSSPVNGNLYINIGRGTADSSWTGITNVDSNQSIVWSSTDSSWFAMNATTQTTVQEIRPGLAIEVIDTNASRPTVAVSKEVTDGWYVDSIQMKSLVDSEHNYNVSRYIVVEDDFDSEHAWNVSEHASLNSKIDSAIDSEHAWNLAEHQILIGADSDLSDKIDSVASLVQSASPWQTQTGGIHYSSGKVSIGTTHQNGRLHVKSTDVSGGVISTFDDNGSTTTGRLEVKTSGGFSSDFLQLQAINRNFRIGHHFGDSFTGMQIVSNTGRVEFFREGDETVVIDAAGNVGIGTSNPTAPLEVAGSGATIDVVSTNTQGVLNLKNSTSGYKVYVHDSDFRIDDRDGFENRITIQGSTGNVGIGVANPQHPLTINAGRKISFKPSDTVNVAEMRVHNDNDASLTYMRYSAYEHDFYTEAGLTATFRRTGDTSFQGNVGIGNNVAYTNLHIFQENADHSGGVRFSYLGQAGSWTVSRHANKTLNFGYDVDNTAAPTESMVSFSNVGVVKAGSYGRFNEPDDHWGQTGFYGVGNVGAFASTSGSALTVTAGGYRAPNDEWQPIGVNGGAAQLQLNNNNGNIIFRADTQKEAGSFWQPQSRMVILGTGEVGIGMVPVAATATAQLALWKSELDALLEDSPDLASNAAVLQATDGEFEVMPTTAQVTQWMSTRVAGDTLQVNGPSHIKGRLQVSGGYVETGAIHRFQEGSGGILFDTSGYIRPIDHEGNSWASDGTDGLSIGNTWNKFKDAHFAGTVNAGTVNSGNASFTGKVGIGTDTPAETLTVSGPILSNRANYASNQDQAYMIAAAKGYNGSTTHWGSYGYHHKLKSNSIGGSRITIDTTAGEVWSMTENGSTTFAGTVNAQKAYLTPAPLSYTATDYNATVGLRMSRAGGGASVQIATEDTGAGTIYFTDNASNTNSGYIQYNHAIPEMVFGTEGTRKLTIDATGNVGIGVTPRSDFTIGGTNKNAWFFNVTAGNTDLINSSAFKISADQSSGNPGSSYIDFKRGAGAQDGSLELGTNDRTRLTIDATGNATFSGTVNCGFLNQQTDYDAVGETMIARFSAYDAVQTASGFQFYGNPETGETVMRAFCGGSQTRAGLKITGRNNNAADIDFLTFAQGSGDATFSGTVNAGSLTIEGQNLYRHNHAAAGGLKFTTFNSIWPTDNTGTNTDGELSLGSNSQKFKDAYFSGTVNSANTFIAVDDTVFTSAMATQASALVTDSDGTSYIDTKLLLKNLLNRIAALES